MRSIAGWVCLASLTVAAGCTPERPPLPPDVIPPEREAKIHRSFDRARAAMQAEDAAGSWSEKRCREVAASFAEVAHDLSNADPVGSRAALFDQGLALSRCKLHDEAAKIFETIVAADPEHHEAQVRVALHRYQAQGRPFLNEAIERLVAAVRASQFKSANALVALAVLQMERSGSAPDADGDGDLERAGKNLRRALAVDDGFMPAFNQLALFYLHGAKLRAGRGGEGHLTLAGEQRPAVDVATLELAALVCSQALQKDPSYAPIHNTAGLVDAELGRLSAAARAFARARALDPRLFEAHMNYAAVNLQFRGFVEAEAAYRDAVKLQPKSYDARLGLALAQRGRLSSNPDEAALAEVEKTLAEAKALAPDRPEAYFNQAILVQEFRARGPELRAKLQEADRLHADFREKASERPELRNAVARSSERSEDIAKILEFLPRDGATQ
ncbi:MAG: hypothetical protein R3B72_22280 [Polyangiaceae bacterium]